MYESEFAPLSELSDTSANPPTTYGFGGAGDGVGAGVGVAAALAAGAGDATGAMVAGVGTGEA